MSRRARRQAKREEAARRVAEAAPSLTANGCEKRPSSLTPRRLRFALLWAEADPEDTLQEVALKAGYSDSVARSGMVAELCRDPAIVKLRDQRLLELQQVASVTVEETLIGLRDLARDAAVPPRDRVAARRALLAWYARDKGQQEAPARGKASAGGGGGLNRETVREFEVTLLGVDLEEETPP